jgi:hypothetical protein
MKKISFLIVIVILLSSFLVVYSADNNATTVKSEIKSVSLDETILLLEKSNPEIILMDKKIELLAKQYEEAVIRSKSFPHQASEKMTKFDIVKEERLDWKTKLLELNNMKHDRAERLKQLKFNVEKMLADITIMQLQEKSLNEDFSAITKRMEQTSLKIKLGLLKNTDIKKIEAQKIKLDSELKNLQRQIKVSSMELRKTIAIDINAATSINEYSYEYKAFDYKELDEKIEKAVASSYEIAKAKEEFELLKLERDIAYHFAENPQPEVDRLDMDISNKESALADLYISEEASLRTEYLNLLNLNDSVEIAKIEKEIAEMELKTAEAQLSVGKLTDMDVLDCRIALVKKEATIKQAINSYMNASQILLKKLDVIPTVEKK